MMNIELGLVFLSLIIWIVLLCFRGQFWRCNQFLQETEISDDNLPSVCAIIPARDEAEVIPKTMRSLLLQNYPNLKIILVDDRSSDGTADVARNVAEELNKSSQLNVITAEPLPLGWTGKLWAIDRGINYVESLISKPDYFLLTDADIEHDPNNLTSLVAKAKSENLDLVSLMVRLRCESFWEKLLIPAFVFFFQKLYPFSWVNDPNNSTAAAAGGCILITQEAMSRIGGIAGIKNALIDDCALALAVKWGKFPLPISREITPKRSSVVGKIKDTESSQLLLDQVETISQSLGEETQKSSNPKGRIWLGLSDKTRSLRPYPTLGTIWDMVARTAFTELKYSPLLLVGTLVGMTIIYVVPPIGVIVGAVSTHWIVAIASAFTYLLMTIAYFPTIRFYQCSPLFAFCLPIVAIFYTLMTLDSAWCHWRGKGGAWKGRVYTLDRVAVNKLK